MGTPSIQALYTADDDDDDDDDADGWGDITDAIDANAARALDTVHDEGSAGAHGHQLKQWSTKLFYKKGNVR